MDKPIIDDELWRRLEPLLPQPKARREKYPGRKPVPDRAALNGIVFVLRTGLRWRDLPAEMGCGSGVTWIDDLPRCRAAGVPDDVGFATKPQLARRMLERALDSGVPCGWVTGDEVYGGDRPLWLWLESRAQPFVLAVKKNEPLWWQGPTYVRPDKIAQALPPRAWRRLSAGIGAKGERLYD
jgi:hypothetical protein